MRITARLLFVGLLSVMTVSCGKNSGTPDPVSDLPPSSDASAPRSDGGSMRLADASQWRAELTWNQDLVFSDEEFRDMTGFIYVRGMDGELPESVTSIRFTADMPQHGHGTGNILPRVKSAGGEPGKFQFENLFFTMTGRWRVRVSATVNGRADTWTTYVDVR